MARVSLKATKGQSLGDGQFVIMAGSGGAATASVSTTTITTDNAATLTAINAMGALSGYSALVGAAAALAAAQTAKALVDTDIAALAPAAAISGDVVLSYDNATITSFNQLKRAVDALLLLAQSSGMV